MFGKPSDSGNGKFAPARRPSSDVARIEGGGLVHVIVTSMSPVTFFLFINDKSIPQMEVDSLEVNVEVESDDISSSTVRASLSRFVTSVTGEQTTQYTSLFPATIEVVALGRRILVTAENADSVENLFVSLGLRTDGTTNDLAGLRSLNIMITNVLVEASLRWDVGQAENILPH